MVTEFEQQILDAAHYTGPPEGGPAHGSAGAAKWIADSDGPGGAPRWEGGYVCHCGQVFARRAPEGGIKAALGLFMAHEASA